MRMKETIQHQLILINISHNLTANKIWQIGHKYVYIIIAENKCMFKGKIEITAYSM